MTVDLPTVHSPDKASLGLSDDIKAVQKAIRSTTEKVTVVAHSYAGVPVAEATVNSAVRHIVCVAAFALQKGESLLGAFGSTPPPWWFDDGVLAGVKLDTFTYRELFYADVDILQAAAAEARLSLQSLRAFTDTLTASSWSHTPSTYIITEHDHTFAPDAQEAFAVRAGSVIRRMQTGHSPFLVAPADLAQIITETLY